MAHGNEINNKRLYWMKMDRHFFNDARIKKMRKLSKGADCVIIYQKLLLLSVEYGGVLVYEGIEDTLEKELALKIGESEKLTESTVQFLIQQGMLVPMKGKDDEFLLVQAQNLIGSETKSNVYKRQKRDGKVWLEKFQPNSNQIPIDIDTEKDIDTDIDTESDIEVRREGKKEASNACAGAREGRKKESLPSYASIMEDWEVGPMTQAALWEFIQYCTLNGKKLTNAKLENIIDRLMDFFCPSEYGDKCDEKQSNEVLRAIQNGWFDIGVFKRTL